MSDKPAYRPAIAADSRFIVDMIDIASDGVALVDWTQSAQKAGDQTALDIGVQRYASEQGDYSYRNCWLAEVAGRRAGALLSFPMPARGAADAVSPPPFDGSDVFAPYKYLEAPGTWYICGLALLPEIEDADAVIVGGQVSEGCGEGGVAIQRGPVPGQW